MHPLHRAMNELNEQFMRLGTLVEENVKRAILALETREYKLAELVIGKDKEIDALEIVVEEECINLLALHHPMARDLRVIVAILKVNNDLERIGDLAVNICKVVGIISKYSGPDYQILAMADSVDEMLKKTLDAMAKLDVKSAREVIAYDDIVDNHRSRIRESVMKDLPFDVDNRQYILGFWSIASHLERIADLATNIAEEIIYVVEGNIIRHGFK
jgi:phosphate transport system protein